MKNLKLFSKFFLIIFRVIKAVSLLLMAVFLFRKKEKIVECLSRRSVILTIIYGALLSLTALVYRVILALNWLLQQAGPR